jgi:hypothetical protein
MLVDEGPAKTALLLHIWSAQSNWASILDYKSEERRSALSEAVQEQYDAMVFRATYAAGTSRNCREDADILLARWPASLPVHVTVADALSDRGSEALEGVIERARELVTDATNFGHRSMLAHLFYLEERWDDVIETLSGFVAHDRHRTAVLAGPFACKQRRREPGEHLLPRTVPRIARNLEIRTPCGSGRAQSRRCKNGRGRISAWQ